jgi:two-component system NtrC family sensor kinase
MNASSIHRNHRILVIDDNPAIHADFQKILCPETGDFDRVEAEFFSEPVPDLSSHLFEIDSAFQGEEGLTKLQQALAEGRPYAMVFLDVRMPPGIDGVETAERLWKLSPSLQVVICTAYSDYSWEEMLARLGASDRFLVLKKPFASVEALQLACALCAKWQLTEEARDRLTETERIVDERTHELRATNERLCGEIQQRETAEAHLLRAQRLESIGTLASGIAHDLNNMLSPIFLCAELLRLKTPEASQDLIAMIESSAERAARVVKQVLTFARGIEGERLPLQPRQLVHEIEKIIGETFPRLIHLTSDVPADLSLIEGDATQIHQVLLNLCVNARDAMLDGGTLRIEASDFEVDENYASMMPGACVGHYVRVQVSDTGNGIPPQHLEKIFDPFFTTKPLGKGTGLGLSTVVGIVRSHGGFLDVHSEMGKGTVFEIFLPAISSDVPVATCEETAAGPAGRGELILVVDDEIDIRGVTQTVLVQNGYRTLSAADGAEAISIFASQIDNIDAVFTDVMMPLVDGIALCRVLRKMDPEVRILAATGTGEEECLRELHALGIGWVLGKPFSTGSLLTALSETLAPPGGGFLS